MDNKWTSQEEPDMIQEDLEDKWVLNRITWPYQCLHCHATRKVLSYGDYFYFHPKTGHVIDEAFYNSMKWKSIKENAMPNVNKAQNEVMYRQMLVQATADFLQRNVLEIDRLQDYVNSKSEYYNILLPEDGATYDIHPFGKEGDIIHAEEDNIWG